MKNIKIILSVVIIAMAASSCVEKSDKYQTLLTQRDSLLVVARNYTQTLDILNEVEAGFNSIGELENSLKSQIDGAEGQSKTKKQQLSAQIGRIKEILEENKIKIAQLQAQLVQSGRKNSALTQTVERLEAELSEKGVAIESLQAELSKKNIKIEELSRTVEALNTDVAELNAVSADQREKIAVQDGDLNRVWYVIGTAKELKTLQILSGNGLFRAKTVMDKDFDKSAFIQTDLRQTAEIATNSKKPKLLSSHPEGSYDLVKDDDKLVTIRVVDPGKFWSVSKYLVIQK